VNLCTSELISFFCFLFLS